ncbi:hypothetical protein AX15_005256 [Amanita polypyramis BW_CC]|nr:hypothetical protein AX15_005256 [Amanita polypyramis BW_CC]
MVFMFSLLTSNLRLANRASFALFNAIKPSVSVHTHLFSPNAVTRSFATTSRVGSAEPEEEGAGKKKKKATKPKAQNTISAEKTKDTEGKKAEKQKPKPKPKPSKIKITPDMKPPRPPAGPYFRFSSERNARHPKASSLQEQATRSKETGEAWKLLSESERQPYYESYRHGREEYLKKRQEWLDNVEPKVLKQLNENRAKVGKPRIVKRRGGPLTPFIQCVLRIQSEVPAHHTLFRFAQNFYAEQQEKFTVAELGQRTGEAWRALPEEEKQQYRDRYRQERDAWQAGQSASA